MDKIESSERTSIIDARSIPTNAIIRLECIKCGKSGCEQEPHVPFIMPTGKKNWRTVTVRVYSGRNSRRSTLVHIYQRHLAELGKPCF